MGRKDGSRAAASTGEAGGRETASRCAPRLKVGVCRRSLGGQG
jgi:hypothetical protein